MRTFMLTGSGPHIGPAAQLKCSLFPKDGGFVTIDGRDGHDRLFLRFTVEVNPKAHLFFL